MGMRLLQIDFAYDGPWGADMAAQFSDLARDIAATPGLRWKIWTESREAGRAGGVYLFDDEDSARRYLALHSARLASFGITDLRALVLETEPTLGALTRAPLG